MSQLISAESLSRLVGTPGLRIADVRFDLADPAAGRRSYRAGHIEGASYLDLDRDLSGPVAEHGGRHPLPDMTAFAAVLANRGIGSDHLVVVYDDEAGMYAGRLWWMLRYLGHDRVKVLDGGMAAWLEAGLPVTTDLPQYPPASLDVSIRSEMVVDRTHVLQTLDDPRVLLIDARAGERYRGEVEPIDRRAGHIPSAVNLPYPGNLEAGRFLQPDALRARFADVVEIDEVVVYCGSGVSATHNLLAMAEAGLENAKLYVGSWSDWSSFADAPVATGEEP